MMREVHLHRVNMAGCMTRELAGVSFLLVVLLAFLSASGAAAQEATPTVPTDDQVNAIARQMYCPVCENTPLDVCPTRACAEWRELIRDKLAQGWSEAQIKQYFVDQFGARVLAAPPPRGFNWLAYVFPPLAFLVGVYLFVRAFQAWREPSPQVALEEDVQPLADKYVSRLEEEVRKL